MNSTSFSSSAHNSDCGCYARYCSNGRARNTETGNVLQMGDGCELDVQSAAAFAQRNEELSYWQLQVCANSVQRLAVRVAISCFNRS